MLADNKQPVKIASFHAVSGRPSADDPAVKVILIVDAVNATLATVQQEELEIEKFLGENGGKLTRPLSIVYFSDLGATIRPPSQDGNATLADLRQNRFGVREDDRTTGVPGATERLQRSLEMLGRIADQEENEPGRKLVVWVSPGWPILSGPGFADLGPKKKQTLFNYIAALSDRLQGSRITLYNVDPSWPAAAGQWLDCRLFVDPVKTPKQADFGTLALPVLAYQSGGALLNSRDLATEIAASIGDADAYYVLSFDEPAAGAADEYHALEVKLDKPGLLARTRWGYYKDPATVGAGDFEELIAEAQISCNTRGNYACGSNGTGVSPPPIEVRSRGGQPAPSGPSGGVLARPGKP